MSTDRLVVVIEPVVTLYSEGLGIHAARFRRLGLSACGHTQEEALENLKRLFNTFVHACREAGTLEERLDYAGVTWHWADQYPEDGPEYEDTNSLRGSDGGNNTRTPVMRRPSPGWCSRVPAAVPLAAAA